MLSSIENNSDDNNKEDILIRRLTTYFNDNDFYNIKLIFRTNFAKYPIKLKFQYNNTDKNTLLASPLWIATYKKYDVQLIEFLLSHYRDDIEESSKTLNCDDDDVDEYYYTLVETTPLFIACLNEQYATAQLLIEHGANINTFNKSKITPLMLSFHNVDFCRYLISHHAQLNLRDNMGYTALHWASSMQSNENIYCLLKCGANPYLKTNGNDNFFVNFTICTAMNYNRNDEENIRNFEELISFAVINHSYKNVLYNLYASIINHLPTKKTLWKQLLPIEKRRKNFTYYEFFYWKDNLQFDILNEKKFQNIVGNDDDDNNLYIQSVITCQKIVNHSHRIVTTTLLNLANSYYVNEKNSYRKAIEILMYALTLISNNYDDNEESYENICKSFLSILYQYKNSIKFNDAFPFFCYFIRKWNENKPNIFKRYCYDATLEYICDILFLIFRINITMNNNKQKNSFTKFIKYNVIPLKLQTYREKNSMLHIYIKSGNIFKDVEVDVITSFLYFLIVICGEDVNVLDINKKSPLYIACSLEIDEKISEAIMNAYVNQNDSQMTLTNRVMIKH